jgi:hypothetical protein
MICTKIVYWIKTAELQRGLTMLEEHCSKIFNAAAADAFALLGCWVAWWRWEVVYVLECFGG